MGFTRRHGNTALLGFIVLGLVAVVGLSAFSAWLLWLLWNWLIPAIFHGPEVTYFQAWGLMVLLGLILGFIRSK